MIEVDFSDSPDSFINVNRRDDLAELQQMPKLLGLAAWSGTGKTTLLKKLLPELKALGIRGRCNKARPTTSLILIIPVKIVMNCVMPGLIRC